MDEKERPGTHHDAAHATHLDNPRGRPFKVLGLQQVAIGHRDKDVLHRLWVDILGLELKGTFKSESENVLEDIAILGKGNTAIELDLMMPIDPDKSPKVHSPPLNHIGLWVDNLRAAMEYLPRNGVRLAGGIRINSEGYEVIFIHPKGNQEFNVSGEGVLVELIQAPPHVLKEYIDGYVPPED